MEKKSKSSIIVIVLFGIIILGLIGFICYDKGVFGKKESSGNENTGNNTMEKAEDSTINSEVVSSEEKIINCTNKCTNQTTYNSTFPCFFRRYYL